MKTIFIIPCYNEENRLQVDLFVNFVQNNKDVGFVFVNDGSADNTLKVLQDMQQKSIAIHILNLTDNCGKGEAVRQGVIYSAQNFCPQYIGFWDADLATPLSEALRFVSEMDKGFEIVTGLRVVRLGANIKRTMRRRYIGRIFATSAAATLSIPVCDTLCGAKLFRAHVACCMLLV